MPGHPGAHDARSQASGSSQGGPLCNPDRVEWLEGDPLKPGLGRNSPLAVQPWESDMDTTTLLIIILIILLLGGGGYYGRGRWW